MLPSPTSQQLSQLCQSKLSMIINMLSKHFNNSDNKNRHHTTINNPKKKNKSYNQLFQQNNTLYYQLQIYRQVLQILQINTNYHSNNTSNTMVDTAKLLVDNKLLMENIEYLKNNIQQVKQTKIQTTNKQNTNDNNNNNNYNKQHSEEQIKNMNTRLYSQIDKYNKLNKKYQECIKSNRQLEVANGKYLEKFKELTNRCKILEGMNRETQDQLVQAIMINKSNNNNNDNYHDVILKKRNIKQGRQRSVQNKQTKNKVNSNIQLLAAKQQVKDLRNQVVMLEEQISRMRDNHLQKQTIYSKIAYNQDNFKKETNNISCKIKNKII